MHQTYTLGWIAEGLAIGFMDLCLWPIVMMVFTTWRLYRMEQYFEKGD